MQKHWYIHNSKGKVVIQPWYFVPNYQDITIVKAQIRWCEETAYWFLIIENNYSLYWEYGNFANLLSLKIQKFIHG